MELTVAALTVATMALVVLWGAGVVVWVRTHRLRHGSAQMPVAPLRARTSATTLIPGVTGLMVMLAGVGLIRAGRGGVTTWVLVAAGALVSGSGFHARVTRVEIHEGGLLVRYRGRPPFAATWPACRGLRPPRWPPGAWTIVTHQGRRRLMPTDVLGQERVLDVLVDRAGLRFGRRRWSRPAVR